jgi:hypothetical protein
MPLAVSRYQSCTDGVSIISINWKAVSRSAWFPPFTGVLIFLYALLDSAIEGMCLSLLVQLLISLTLIAYRSWPSSCRARTTLFILQWILLVGCLVAQAFMFVVDSSNWSPWFGEPSVPGLVLDGLCLVLFTFLTLNKIPTSFNSPGRLRLWKTPQAIQVSAYIVVFATCSIFNPSILILPLFAVLLRTLYQVSSRVPVTEYFVSSMTFPRYLMYYLFLYAAVGFSLAVPGIADYINSVDFRLPYVLGICKTGEASNSSSLNYASILPSTVSLFALFVFLPWWIPVVSHRRGPRVRASTRDSAGTGLSRAGSVDPSLLGYQSPPHRGASSLAGSSMAELSPEGEKNLTSEWNHLRIKVLKGTRYVISTLIFPLALVVVGLVLPSSLSVVMVFSGLGLFAFPKFLSSFGWMLGTYLSLYSAAVFVCSVVWTALDRYSYTAEGIGIVPRDESNIWERFLLLLGVVGMTIGYSIVERFCVDDPTRNQTGEPLTSVPEDTENPMEEEPKTFATWVQLLVEMMRSAEFTLVAVLSIIFITSYIYNQTSAISIVYILVTLPALWFSTGRVRAALSTTLVIISSTFASAVVLWVSWSTVNPGWIYDLGFPDPIVETCFITTLPHVLVAITGSIYIRLESTDTSNGLSVISTSLGGHPMVYSKLALLIPMVLSLVLFVTMPFDYFSALIILCFIVQMVLLQESTGASTYLTIIRVNIMEMVILVSTLIWVLFSMIPVINDWVTSGLEGNEYLSPVELAVEPDCMYLDKLCILASLLVTSSLMLRHRQFIESASSSPSDNSTDWLTTSPVLSRIVIVVSSQLPRVLLFIIFVACVYQTTFFNVCGELVICLFLIAGRGWGKIGSIFSVLSMAFLLLQYLASFSLIEAVTDSEFMDYVGMSWSSGSVGRNITIFLACIIQRNVEHFVMIHYGKRAIFFESLEKYSGILIGILLMLAAVGRGNIYSIIYAVMGIGFIVHQSWAKGNFAIGTWTLTFVGVIIWISIGFQLCLRLWFPPGWNVARPDLSFMCSNESGNEWGSCIDDWQRFFNVPTSVHGNTLLVDDNVLRESIASSVGLSTGYEMPSIKGYGVIWDFVVLLLVCTVKQNQRIQNSLTSMSSVSNRPTSSDSSLSSRSRRQRWAVSIARQIAKFWIIIVEVLAIISCFSYRETVDAFNIVFLGFTLVLFWSQEKQAATRRTVTVAGCFITSVAILLSILYQIPSFACKYWSATCESEPSNPAFSTNHYAVPTMMCVEIQDLVRGCENFGAFTLNQVFFQVIGLLKSSTRFFASPFPMTVGPPVLLMAALFIQLALHDHSSNYARIDQIHFVKEASLRQVRARRLVVEFNASLYVRTRKVHAALEANRRKLQRVQELANERLKIFYSRLAGVAYGEVVRTQSDYLSTEAEGICSRGYSADEAALAVQIASGQPEGTGLLVLETAADFALGYCQESDVFTRTRKLLEDTDTVDDEEIEDKEWTSKVAEAFTWLNDRLKYLVSECIEDVAFLSDIYGAEPLSLHRNGDSLIVLCLKALYSNSLFFVCFFSTLSFVASNSVYDFLRIAFLLTILPSWPFSSVRTWKILLVYTCVGISVKAIYQLPIFCAVGIDSSNSLTAGLWRWTSDVSSVDSYILPCPAGSIVGWDVIVGMPKMLGSSAIAGILTYGLVGVIWQDILILASLFMYRSLLYKCGLWEHILVAKIDQDGGAVLIRRKTKVESDMDLAHEGSGDPVEDDDVVNADDNVEAPVEVELNLEIADEDSPIGSFVDLDYAPLDPRDRQELSRYAVQRHMCCEDVLGRIVHENNPELTQLVEIYKWLRWDAQFQYANNDCVRIDGNDLDNHNEGCRVAIARMNILSKLFVYVNPFYSVKVGVDYYTYIFTISLMMFFHVIIFYPSMSNSATSADFVSSLKESRFSAGLALLMFLHFVMIVVDRAYYIASFRRSNVDHGFFLTPSRQQVSWYFTRVIILVTLTIVLNAVIMDFMYQEAVTSYSALIRNKTLSVYYLEFMLYILISALQLKEGFPRVIKESLRPAKSYHPFTDKVQEIRFIIYRAIPFLDELRILIDWTVSKTCLDLLQYFKLEDAHTYMWQTKRDMETRKKFWPAEPIRKVEKAFCGCGLLLLLMLVIIGPVLLFSTLISAGTVAPIVDSTVYVSIRTQTCSNCDSYTSSSAISTSEMNIYKSVPSSMVTVDAADAAQYLPSGYVVDPSYTVQVLDLSKGSDDVINIFSDRFAFFNSTVENAVMINFDVELNFIRRADGYQGPLSTVSMPSCACKSGFESLCDGCYQTSSVPMSVQFSSILTATMELLNPSQNPLVYIPQVFPTLVEVDSTNALKEQTFSNSSIAVAILTDRGQLAGWEANSCGGPEYAAVCPGKNGTSILSEGSDPKFTIVLAPVYSSDSTGGALLSIGIVTVYITIVYAIGRFLRLVFDKESLRVIYLEIPRPDDFLDLATGASIARHHKDLAMEFKLYNCLIKVMRSPETLIALGGSDLTGYGAGRHDDPPHPDLLGDEDRTRLLRRRRKKRK